MNADCALRAEVVNSKSTIVLGRCTQDSEITLMSAAWDHSNRSTAKHHSRVINNVYGHCGTLPTEKKKYSLCFRPVKETKSK